MQSKKQSHGAGDRKIQFVAADELAGKPAKRNPKDHDIGALTESIRRHGFVEPVVVDGRTGRIVAGHGRVEALVAMAKEGADPPDGVRVEKNKWLVPTVAGWASESDRQAEAYVIASNRIVELGGWDQGMLEEMLKDLAQSGELEGSGYDGDDVDKMLLTAGDDEATKGSLVSKFGIPPLSVFDAKQGYWRERVNKWKALGIDSGLGRSDALIKGGTIVDDYTSIFDPVLCEALVRWFSPVGGRIFDPFAGGSVRGVVSSILGRKYVGVDIRKEQVVENEKAAKVICKDPMPKWVVGDATKVSVAEIGGGFDMIMTCPPYGDLEKYSDDKADLSNMPNDQFLEMYAVAISNSVKFLADNRFACFVVGEYRTGKRGAYSNFVGKTVDAFEAAGMDYYSEAVLSVPVGSAALRAPPLFSKSRKIAKVHQNVLVFLKGDYKKAVEACGEIEADFDVEEIGKHGDIE